MGMTEYRKGYEAAQKKWQKKLKDLKEEYESRIIHHVSTYPFNLIQDILEELHKEDCELYDFSEKQILKVMQEKLSERENKVLQLYYERNYTYEQIGKEFNVTRERIRQIHASAIEKLKYPLTLNSMRVVSFIDYMKLQEENTILKEKLNILYRQIEEKSKCIENEKDKKLEKDISYLNLTGRSYNCLIRKGIRTIQDLVDFINVGHEPSEIRNLGKKSAKEIVDKLKEYGIDVTEYWRV